MILHNIHPSGLFLKEKTRLISGQTGKRDRMSDKKQYQLLFLCVKRLYMSIFCVNTHTHTHTPLTARIIQFIS